MNPTRFLATLVLVWILAAAALGVLLENANARIPRCEEDQVIVGTGDFAAGQWTSYVCGPAVDDYIEGSQP